MAEPLSVFASILAIVTAGIQSSRALVEITKDINTGSEEIKSISRDAQSVHYTICALRAALRLIETKKMNLQDDIVVQMITSLISPLSGCETTLAELASKLQKVSKYNSRDFEKRTNFIGFRWAFFIKHDVKDLQVRLESQKSTLNTALSGISA